MAKIDQLKNTKTEEIIYPITKTIAVYNDNNKNLDDLLNNVSEQLEDCATKEELDKLYLTDKIVIDQRGENPVITGDVNGKVVQKILDNAHVYLAKYLGEREGMAICQLDDRHKEHFVYGGDNFFHDGTVADIQWGRDGDVFVRFPAFSMDAEELEPDVWEISITYGKKPNTYNYWDPNNLIGTNYTNQGMIHQNSQKAYCNPFTSASGTVIVKHLSDWKPFLEAKGSGFGCLKYSQRCMLTFLTFAVEGSVANTRYLTGARGINFCGLASFYSDWVEYVDDIVINNRVPVITMPDGSTRTAETLFGEGALNSGYYNKIQIGKYLDILPKEADATEETGYLSMGWTSESIGAIPRMKGGSAMRGDEGFVNASYDSPTTESHIRLVYNGKITEIENVEYFKSLPVETEELATQKYVDDKFINVNGHEYVDMGEAGLWATCNIGANLPQEAGLHFAWGETEGYSDATEKEFTWEDYKFGASTELTKYNETDGLTVLEPEDDAAHVNMGGDWRIPTTADFKKLFDLCTVQLVYYIDGSLVYLVSLKSDETKRIILPRTSVIYSGSNKNTTNAYYWSSSLYTNKANAYCVLNNTAQSNTVRHYGCCVRGFIPANLERYLTNDKAEELYQPKGDYATKEDIETKKWILNIDPSILSSSSLSTIGVATGSLLNSKEDLINLYNAIQATNDFNDNIELVLDAGLLKVNLTAVSRVFLADDSEISLTAILQLGDGSVFVQIDIDSEGKGTVNIYNIGTLLTESVKQNNKTPIRVLNNVTELSAELSIYYRFDNPVNTLNVKLPAIEDYSAAKSIMLYFTTGYTPAINIEASDNVEVSHYSGYIIEPNTTYELNIMFNGIKWIVAYAVVE